MATDIAALARESYEELWNRGDLGYVDQAFAPDFVGHDVFPGRYGREEMKERVRQFRAAFPDVRFRVDDVLVSGDQAVVRWTCTGTHRGAAFHGIPSTGRSFTVSGVRVSRYVGGKLAESWTYWDVLKLFASLGVMPHQVTGVGARPHVQLDAPEVRLRQ